MEVQATDSAAPQESLTTNTSEASQPEVSAKSPEQTSPVDQVAAQGGDTQAPQAPQAYTPNFKFSVMKKEHEIPEEFRPIITDPEKEKKVKEIFEKAHGIDFVKTERAKIQEDYKSYRSQTEPIMKIATKLDQLYRKDDLDGYFATLGLAPEKVMKWAVKFAELQRLPEDQKRVYDQQRAAEQRAQILEEQLQEQTQSHQQFVVNQRLGELDQTVSSPQISSFVQSFDQRNGDGAFRAEIIARGQYYWHTQGIDVPPAHLANEIMTRFGASQVQAQPQAVAQPSNVKAPRDLPTIPNTGNSNGSPAKRKISSVADLEKAYKELS